LRDILKQAFDITHDSETQQKEKLVAMNLIKEIVSAKVDLLTNVTVVDDVVKFINKEKEIMKNINSNNKKDSNNNTNNNSDYDFGNEQKEQQVQRQTEGNYINDKEEVATIDNDIDLQVF
jgi:hypothetical protein